MSGSHVDQHREVRRVDDGATPFRIIAAVSFAAMISSRVRPCCFSAAILPRMATSMSR